MGAGKGKTRRVATKSKAQSDAVTILIINTGQFLKAVEDYTEAKDSGAKSAQTDKFHKNLNTAEDLIIMTDEDFQEAAVGATHKEELLADAVHECAVATKEMRELYKQDNAQISTTRRLDLAEAQHTALANMRKIYAQIQKEGGTKEASELDIGELGKVVF